MVYVYPMYGLGGRVWSWPIEDYVADALRAIPGIKVYKTRSYGLWRDIAAEINALPKGSKSVVIGHSMGAGAATAVTDLAKVDLVVCYDCAGWRPSGIANNTGKLFDFWDRAFALVPKYRPWAYPGHSGKIKRFETRYGHTGQPHAPDLLKIVSDEIKAMRQ